MPPCLSSSSITSRDTDARGSRQHPIAGRPRGRPFLLPRRPASRSAHAAGVPVSANRRCCAAGLAYPILRTGRDCARSTAAAMSLPRWGVGAYPFLRSMVAPQARENARWRAVATAYACVREGSYQRMRLAVSHPLGAGQTAANALNYRRGKEGRGKRPFLTPVYAAGCRSHAGSASAQCARAAALSRQRPSDP